LTPTTTAVAVADEDNSRFGGSTRAHECAGQSQAASPSLHGNRFRLRLLNVLPQLISALRVFKSSTIADGFAFLKQSSAH